MKKFLLALLTVGLFTSQASASPILSYDDIDIGYKWTHFNDSDFDNANGLEAGIRYSPIENFFVEGGYEYFNTEIQNFDVDQHLFRYGGGYYMPFGCDDMLHAVARVGGLHIDLNGDYDEAASDDGVYAGALLRARVMDQVEVAGGAEYNYFGDFGNRWIYNVQGLYAVSESVALNTKVEITDDSDVSWLGGVRIEY